MQEATWYALGSETDKFTSCSQEKLRSQSIAFIKESSLSSFTKDAQLEHIVVYQESRLKWQLLQNLISFTTQSPFHTFKTYLIQMINSRIISKEFENTLKLMNHQFLILDFTTLKSIYKVFQDLGQSRKKWKIFRWDLKEFKKLWKLIFLLLICFNCLLKVEIKEELKGFRSV